MLRPSLLGSILTALLAACTVEAAPMPSAGADTGTGSGYLIPADIDSVNRILAPLGLHSLPVSLDWGEVDGEIELPCFPPVG